MDLETSSVAFSLTRGMARTLGLNIVEAVAEGWLTRPELARLVTACQSCGLSEQCFAWLAVTPKAAGLPDYCRNKSELEGLVV